MDADRWLPATSAGLVLGLVIAMLLLIQRRRLPADLVGRVKADAYLAMLRAMLVLLAGLGIALGATVAAPATFVVTLRWVAMGLIAIGGVAFVARAALYLLHIKPQLAHLQAPVAPVLPAVDLGETGLGEVEGSRSRETGRLPRTDED